MVIIIAIGFVLACIGMPVIGDTFIIIGAIIWTLSRP